MAVFFYIKIQIEKIVGKNSALKVSLNARFPLHDELRSICFPSDGIRVCYRFPSQNLRMTPA